MTSCPQPRRSTKISFPTRFLHALDSGIGHRLLEREIFRVEFPYVEVHQDDLSAAMVCEVDGDVVAFGGDGEILVTGNARDRREIDDVFPVGEVLYPVDPSTGTKHESIVPRATIQAVVARAAIEGIVTRATIKEICAFAAIERIVTRVAFEHIVARAATKRIVARAAFELIVAGAGIERIVAPFSIHDIPARSARERIGFFGALHRKYEIL